MGGVDLGNNSEDVQTKLACGVRELVSTHQAFAALKDDGSVVSWGRAQYGGDSTAVAAQIGSGVVQIAGTKSAFAAMKDDGSVVCWGVGSVLGIDSVKAQLSVGVLQIAASWGEF